MNGVRRDGMTTSSAAQRWPRSRCRESPGTAGEPNALGRPGKPVTSTIFALRAHGQSTDTAPRADQETRSVERRYLPEPQNTWALTTPERTRLARLEFPE